MSKIVEGNIVALILALFVMSPIAAGQYDLVEHDEQPVVSLESIIQNPAPYRGLTVSFVAQFHGVGTLDNPFYTRFETNWYMNFSVWPDTSALWQQDAYRKDFPYLFISRISEGVGMLTTAPVYSRWIITGTISDIFRGTPYIEVKGLEQLPTQLNQASLIKLVKGFRLEKMRMFEAAAMAFRESDAETLPPNIRTMAMRHEALALHETGRTSEAIERLQLALGIMPEDPVMLATLSQLEATLPQEQPLEEPLEPSQESQPAPARLAEAPAREEPAPQIIVEPHVEGPEPQPAPAPAPAPQAGTATIQPASPPTPQAAPKPQAQPTPPRPAGGVQEAPSSPPAPQNADDETEGEKTPKARKANLEVYPPAKRN